MHLIRDTYGRTARIICFLFAVHLFNFSVDPKDRQSDFVAEDLTINDIESLAEFFAEVILGIEDAFTEHDEPGPENGGSVDSAKIFFVSHEQAHMIFACCKTGRIKYFIWNSANYTPFTRAINAPPPKA